MFCALHPASPNAQSPLQAQNPGRERGSGFGPPGKGLSSFVGVKEEEMGGQEMRVKSPQQPHQLSAQITSALWYRPDD